jgi:hypothetical protein
MTSSGRPSDRVVDVHRNDLAERQISTARGADGGATTQSPRRTSARQLAAIQQALSEQSTAVLKSIRQMHFMTTRQVERMHFHDGSRTPLAAARATRRCLERLHEIGLIERLQRRVGGVRAGSASYVVTLSPVGARFFSDSVRRRSREPSLLHLDHVLAVTELVVQLKEVERAGAIEILRSEVEPTCWRPFVAAHGARGLLKPDLRIAVVSEDVERHWFVEIDRGSEHAPVIRRKMQTYLDAWRAGIEQDGTPFPQVLWVVPDDRRGDAIERALSALAGMPKGMAAIAISSVAVGELCGGHR